MNSGADVVAVSLNSREGGGTDAARKAAKAAAFVPSGIPVFKKIDSRLKGHVRVEVEAIVSAMDTVRVVLCPAIPAMGRIVRDGMLQGLGVDVPINCEEIMGRGFATPGMELVTPDAENDDDLDRIVARFFTKDTLFCGARGLAAALARKLSGGKGRSQFGEAALRQPILFAIGSRDPITLRQVEALRTACADISYLAAPDGWIPEAKIPEGNLIIQTIAGAAPAGSHGVTAAFAVGVAERAATGRASLFLTGGETAGAVLNRLGIGILEIIGEPLPGTPASVPLGAGAPVIVTKSGGFGGLDALALLAGFGAQMEGLDA